MSEIFIITPEQKIIQASYNDNNATLTLNTTGDQAEAELSAKFNDGEKECQIRALATNDKSTLTHTANHHIFQNGVEVFADNAAAITGGLEVGTLYYRTGHGLDIVIQVED